MKPLKIGIISKTLVASANPEWVSGLARGLHKLGHRVEIVYLREPSVAPPGFLVPFEGLDMTFLLRGWLARLSEAIGWPISMGLLGGGYGREGSPDPLSWIFVPVFSHRLRRFDLAIFYDPYSGITGVVSNILFSLKYVTFVHEAIAGSPKSLLGKLERHMLRLVSERAVLTAGINESITKSLAQMGLPRTKTIASGCIRDPRAPNSKKEFVLFDTRWTPARNPAFALEIAKLSPGIRFVMIGSFWTRTLESEIRQKVVAEGLDNRFIIRTNLSPQEVRKHYREASVFVRWSAHGTGGWERGIPMGILTAMSVGCPIVIDENLGCAPLLAEILHGYILPYHPKEFANAVTRIVRTPSERTRLVGISLKLAERFSWTKSARALLDILCNEEYVPD